jgi:hypothetical protein
MCISCVPKCLLHVYQFRPKLSATRVSVAPQSVCYMCISCIPKCLLHVYQLRPELSTPSMTNSMPRAHHLPREFLPSGVCLIVIVNLRQLGGLGAQVALVLWYKKGDLIYAKICRSIRNIDHIVQ